MKAAIMQPSGGGRYDWYAAFECAKMSVTNCPVRRVSTQLHSDRRKPGVRGGEGVTRAASLTGTVLDGKYSVDKILGEGGMGAVYRARHLGTKRIVALKVIVPRMTRSAEFVERFRREAESAGGLRHPNVVDVTDFGFAHLGDEEIAY